MCYIYCFWLHQGERLSHAVGCAFAACLERKQRREKECGVTASFDASRTSFVREGSFRANSSCSQQGSSSERDDKLQDKKKGSRIFQSVYTYSDVSFKKCSHSWKCELVFKMLRVKHILCKLIVCHSKKALNHRASINCVWQ